MTPGSAPQAASRVNAPDRAAKPARRRWPGLGVTLATLVMLESLAILGYRVPNPPAFILLAVVFAAYSGGLHIGLTSAVLAWMYFAWSFSLPGNPFHYSEPDWARVLIWLFATPTMAILVGTLRRDADRAHAEAVRAAASEAVAQARIAPLDELRASEHRYRTLAATMVEGILILRDGRFAYANPGALQLLGFSFEELEGREFAPFIHAEFRDMVRERHRRRSAGEVLEPRYDIRILVRSGEPRWVQIANEKIEWEGQPAVLTVITDITERKVAEQALRASEERFGKMFRAAPEAMTLVRAADATYLDVNREFEKQTGFARQEVVGRTSLDLGLWHVPQERAAMLRRLHESGGLSNLEFVLRRRAGELRSVQLDCVTIEIAGEACWLFILRDITERKRAEAALRDSEQRFRVLSELSADFYWEQDEHLRFIERVGHTWERHSYPAAGVMGKTRWELPALNLSEEDWKRHRADLDARREFRNLEIERPLPSGGTRWISTSGRPIFDAEGRFQGYRGVGTDITERKRAERALRESEQRFRALVDLSSDWYWATDTEHRFTFREGEILRRMGIPPEDDYGKRRWEMGFLNLDERAWAEHRALLERREEFRDLLLERRSLDGRVHWATISGRPQFDAEGRFIGYHGTGRDVTRQVLAERHLRQLNEALEQKVAARTADLDAANRELEAFSYSVSHDLRAPLRQIDGFLRLLSRELPQPGEKAAHYLGTITSAAQRMSQLIEDLLAFSRIGRAELKKRDVDLSALARLVAKELVNDAPERRVEWRIAEGLTAHADAGLMRVVLENLLGNAWKYTRRKPQATIEFGRTATGEFKVRDDGAGFDPKFAKTLFQPFRRLHAAQEFEGSGVGLATVRRIVERHGGSVRAEGTVEAGATFYFTLPPA